MVANYRIWNLEHWSTGNLYGDVMDEREANRGVNLEKESFQCY